MRVNTAAQVVPSEQPTHQNQSRYGPFGVVTRKDHNTMKYLYLIRGVSGSGKTTFARELALELCLVHNLDINMSTAPEDVVHNSILMAAADDHRYQDGVYNHNLVSTPEAHSRCQALVKAQLLLNKFAVVHNTFTTEWEILPYCVMAKEANAQLIIIHVQRKGDNETLAKATSGRCPEAGVAAQRSRWQVLNYETIVSPSSQWRDRNRDRILHLCLATLENKSI